MKTLILGPLDYPSARLDLILMNYKQNIYSIYFAFEGIYSQYATKGEEMPNQTATILLLAEQMTEKEYESADIFFGLAPKKFHFDRIIEYNYDILSTQEAALENHIPDFEEKFYTTADITHSCKDFKEAVEFAQSPATESDSE